MDESAVARSAMKAPQKIFPDGVIAPIFWFLIGGLPGLLAYNHKYRRQHDWLSNGKIPDLRCRLLDDA